METWAAWRRQLFSRPPGVPESSKKNRVLGASKYLCCNAIAATAETLATESRKSGVGDEVFMSIGGHVSRAMPPRYSLRADGGEAAGAQLSRRSRTRSGLYPFGAVTAHVVGDLRTGENFHVTNGVAGGTRLQPQAAVGAAVEQLRQRRARNARYLRGAVHGPCGGGSGKNPGLRTGLISTLPASFMVALSFFLGQRA